MQISLSRRPALGGLLAALLLCGTALSLSACGNGQYANFKQCQSDMPCHEE